MVAILYTFDRAFVRKTFEAIDRHVDVESASLPLRSDAEDCSTVLREVERSPDESVDELVDRLDPDAIVRNHRYQPDEVSFERDRTVVHVRHGASVVRERRSRFRARVGIPMDGRAGERAATEVTTCTE